MQSARAMTDPHSSPLASAKASAFQLKAKALKLRLHKLKAEANLTRRVGGFAVESEINRFRIALLLVAALVERIHYTTTFLSPS